MELKIEHEFELTVGEDTYTGVFVDLTKKETKSLDKYSPTKELKKVKKLQRKAKHAKGAALEKIEDDIEELMDIIESFDTDTLYKERLKLSVSGDDKAAILAVGEKYGYGRVFDTIIEDIAERRSGN